MPLPPNKKMEEQALVYWEMEKSILYSIHHFWGLTPQPVKEEYRARWELGLLLRDQDWSDFVKNVTKDWFVQYEDGKHVTWQQALVFFGIDKALKGECPMRISIVSGHGIGKSCMLSMIVLWFLFIHPDAQVACTSPGQQQLYDVLWKELKKWIEKMPKGMGDLFLWESSHIRMKEAPETWFARAKTASKENTEALAGVHADYVLIAADEACHDEQTEVLTDDGWKYFKKLDWTERLMTMDGWQKPTRYHEYEHSGEMIASNLRGADFMVTPNHDLYGKTSERGYRDRSYQKRKAGKINGQDFHIPRIIKWEGVETYTEDEMRLFGWIVSEGSFQRYKNAKVNSIVISQSLINKENREEIISLIERMGYKPGVYKKDIVIHSVELAEKMLMFGEGFKNKFIPFDVKNQSPRLLSLFLDTFMLGDGYCRGNREILYTSSKQLADDLQEIILKTGYNSTVTLRKIKGQRKWIKDHWATSSCDGYIISRSYNGSHFKINHKKIKRVNYMGKVYCATVPNGLLLTRRNGKVMWSGNSGVEEPIYETMEGSLTSGNTLVFLISNGTRSLGYFYDTHHNDKQRWQTYSFSSLDSPRVDEKYVKSIVEKYGADSVQYAIRVEGKFPDVGIMDDKGYVQLFSEKDLHMVPYDHNWIPVGRAICGLDASGEGQDSTQWAVRDRARAGIVASEQQSTAAGMAQKTITICDKYRVAPIDTVIDAFGVGHAVSQEIALATSGNTKRQAWRVTPLNVGEQCDDPYDRELYVNKRAEAFYKMMLWMRAGGEIMSTDRLQDELFSIRYRRTIGGKIQIMDKVSMGKLGYASPNMADALSLTFLRPDGIRLNDNSYPQADTFDKFATAG